MASVSERVICNKRGETWRGTGIMLQGQTEGSMKSNAKRRRRRAVKVGGESGRRRRRKRR